MSDDPNTKHLPHGYQDADEFTNADPPPPKQVHAVNSGRIDPHLTHYVGVEAAREIRALFDEILRDLDDPNPMTLLRYLSVDHETWVKGYMDRLNDLLGLHE